MRVCLFAGDSEIEHDPLPRIEHTDGWGQQPEQASQRLNLRSSADMGHAKAVFGRWPGCNCPEFHKVLRCDAEGIDTPQRRDCVVSDRIVSVLRVQGAQENVVVDESGRFWRPRSA